MNSTPLPTTSARGASTTESAIDPGGFSADGQPGTVPRTLEVLQEELSVGRRVTDTGTGIRVHKSVHTDWVEYDATRIVETADVECVAIGRVVEGPVPTRYEGAVLVVPIVEERLVVRKELVLVEELRITHRQRAIPGTERVALRRESASVERFGPGSGEGVDSSTNAAAGTSPSARS